MSFLSDKTAAKLTDLKNMLGGGSYNPQQNRDLLGDWTDELTRGIQEVAGVAHADPSIFLHHISEAVNGAVSDDTTGLHQLFVSDRQKAVSAIEGIIDWVEEKHDAGMGVPSFAARRVVKNIPAALTAQAPSEVSNVEPELSNKPPISAQELAMFEVPPEGLSEDQFDEEKYNRKERKNQKPLRYPSLSEKDIDPDADMNKVYRAIRFFLGLRDLEVQGKTKTKTFPSRSSDMADVEKRDVIGRLLATIRDNKIKAWKAAVDKRAAGEDLTPDEKKHAKLFGSSYKDHSIEGKYFGMKKSHFDNMINNMLKKWEKETASAYTDVPTGSSSRARDLNVALHGLVDYLKGQYKEVTVEKTKTDPETNEKTPVLDPKTNEPVMENKPIHGELHGALNNLAKYIDMGGVDFDLKEYKDLVKNFKAEAEVLNLTPDEMKAVFELFPDYVAGSEDEKVSITMLTPEEALNKSEEDLKDARGQVNMIKERISGSQEDVRGAEDVVKRIQSDTENSMQKYKEARAVSEDIAPQAQSAFREIASRVKIGKGENRDSLPAKRAALVESVKAKFVDARRAAYGEDAVKVGDLVAQSVLAEYRAKDARVDLRKHGKVGGLITDLEAAKARERDVEKSISGIKSLAAKPKNDIQGMIGAGNNLVKSVEDTVTGAREKTSFNEVTSLIDRIATVRKALTRLSRADKAKTPWDRGISKGYEEKVSPEQKAKDEEKAQDASHGMLYDLVDLVSLVGDGKKKKELNDPIKVINGILNHKLVNFLLDKSTQLMLGPKGHPEKVKGPSFDELSDIIDVFKKAESELKNYDPRVIAAKLTKSALSKLSVGSQFATMARKKDRAEKQKQERLKTKMEAEKTKKQEETAHLSPETPTAPATVSEEKGQQKLSSVLRSFMAKIAALRVVSRLKSKTAAKSNSPAHWNYGTKRETKAGPVFLEPFFINPDGVDEFVQALGRGGFSFLKSVSESGKKDPLDPERSEREDLTGKEPKRGYKINIDPIIAETMLKGSANLHEHILNNKERMAAVLGKNLEGDRRTLKELKSQLDNVDSELSSSEMERANKFLTALAKFINNPEEKTGEAVSRAFPEKTRRERGRSMRAIQSDLKNTLYKVDHYDAFKKRRDVLAKKYKGQGDDPESHKDYQYVDEVVRDVDYLKDKMDVGQLREVYDLLPNYDRMKVRLDKLSDQIQEAGKDEEGNVAVDSDVMEEHKELSRGIKLVEQYASLNPKFKKMQKDFPFESRRKRDPGTEKLYEEAQAIPEEQKKEIRKKHEERASELSDLESFEDWKRWIVKLQKPLAPKSTVNVEKERTRDEKALEQAKSDLSKATGAVEAAKKAVEVATQEAQGTEEGSRPRRALESKKGDLSKAEGAVSALQDKVKKMETREIKPGTHEPRALTNLWNNFNSNVKAAILGKEKFYPKYIVDFAESQDVIRTEHDKLVKMVSDMERQYESKDPNERVIPKGGQPSDEKWKLAKDSIEEALTEKKKAMEDIAAKVKGVEESLKASNLSDEQKQDIGDTINSLRNDSKVLEANSKSVRDIVDNLDKMRGSQETVRGASLEELKKKAQEHLGQSIPDPNYSPEETQSAIDDLIGNPDLLEKDTNGQIKLNNDVVSSVGQKVRDLTESSNALSDYMEEADRLAKELHDHPATEKDEAGNKMIADLKRSVQEARKKIGINPAQYAGTELAKKFEEASVKNLSSNMPPEDKATKMKAISDEAQMLQKEFVARATETLRRESLPEDWAKSEEKKEKTESPKMVSLRYLEFNPPIKDTFKPMISNLESTVSNIAAKKSASGPELMTFIQTARKADQLYMQQLEYMEELAKNLNRHTEPSGSLDKDTATEIQKRLMTDYNMVKSGWEKLFGEDWDMFFQHASSVPEKSMVTDMLAKILTAIGSWTNTDKASVKSWLGAHKKALKGMWDTGNKIRAAMGEGKKKEEASVNGRAQVQKPEDTDPFWTVKTKTDESGKPVGTVRKMAASEDFDPTNIENWLGSAPRKYLESLPKISVNDWDIIESLYGKKKSEYDDIIHGNQMILNSNEDKAKVKALMEEAARKGSEKSRMEALKDARVNIDGRDIRISEAGSVFNRELSKYLSRKNALLIKRKDIYDRLMKYQYAVDTGEKFVSDAGEWESDATGKKYKKHKMDTELTRRETQSIADQFYRGLFWYLQDYWGTGVGSGSVFGGRDSAEFSHLYDTMKAIADLRSNPTIQKVIMAGNNARKELREVKEAISRTRAGMKKLGVKPDDVLDRVAARYGNRNFREEDLKGLNDRAEKDKRTSREPGFASGVNLYFLMAHRDQLLAMIRQKKSMYNLLSESADIQYKVSVLNSIAARTKDPSVKKEIEERIKLMQKALDEDIVKKKKRAEEAEKEAQEVSLEADKTRKEVPILQEAIEESGLTDAKQEGVPEGMPKQASYRNDPNFDLTVFYGSVLQAKIADMTARQLIINQSK